MADVFKNAQGVWTNQGVDPADPVQTSADPNAPYERDGVLYQRTPGGHELAIGAAHNDIHDEAHPEVAARDFLDALDRSPEQRSLDLVNASQQQSDADTQALEEAKQANPVGRAANWLTPGKVGTAAGLASLIPGVAPIALSAAAAADPLLEALRVHYDEPNAAQSFPEAAGGALEATAPAGVAMAGGAAMKALPKVAALAAKPGVVGAGLGGAYGYRHGGVFTSPGLGGAVEGAVEGGTLGKTFGGRIGALLKAAGMAPEAVAPEVAAEAEAGAPFPRAVRTVGGQQVPEKSVDDVLMRSGKNYVPPRPFTPSPTPREYEFSPREPRSALNDISEADVQRLAKQSGDVYAKMKAEGAFGGDRTVPSDGWMREMAKPHVQPTPAPDLMDQYTASLENGQGSGKQSFEMGGVQYAPDETGSHVALRRAALADTPPIEGDNPVVSRTLKQIRDEAKSGVLDPETAKKATAQAQMLRRKKGGGR